jgi:hypothetical protein
MHASFLLKLFSLQQMFRVLVCIEACCTSCTDLLLVSDFNRNIKVSINTRKSSECRISWKILWGARVVADRRADTCSHGKPNWRMFVNFRYRGPEHKSQSRTLYLRITFMRDLHVTIGVLYYLEPYRYNDICVCRLMSWHKRLCIFITFFWGGGGVSIFLYSFNQMTILTAVSRMCILWGWIKVIEHF